MTNLVGQQLNNLRIDALLGKGGMGSVYKAQDLNLNRPVALKVMHDHLAAQPEFKKRFLQEAQAIARLNHPAIVRIFNFESRGSTLYMVMEFLPGGSFTHHYNEMRARRQVIALNETLYLMAQVCDGVDYAHKQGIIHRDLKPDNILLQPLDKPRGPGQPALQAVVTDFGIARLLEGGVQTETGSILGTLDYMSPEQFRGQQLDGRSDIYALGIMLFQLVTGRKPFNINTPAEAINAHLNTPLPNPLASRPGLPPAVVTIINKATAKNPDARYQRADEMAAGLRQVAGNLRPADYAAFAPAGQTMRLQTQLQDLEAFPDPTRLGYDLTAGPAAQLLVARSGQAPQTHNFPADKTTVTIGRGSDNDLVLNEAAVSRNHARLERTAGGWQVTDLNSSNGSYLEGIKLLAGVPEPWTAGKSLKIGPFVLNWRGGQAVGPAGVAAAAGIAGSVAGPGPYNRKAGDEIGRVVGQTAGRGGVSRKMTINSQVAVVLSPNHFELAPGDRTVVNVQMLNQGQTVEHFALSLQGLPTAWFTAPAAPLQLLPGHDGHLSVTLHPPRGAATRAGDHPFRLTMRSTNNPNDQAVVEGKLTIAPYEEFTVNAAPQNIPAGGLVRVEICNRGNDDGRFVLSGTDPAEKLRFSGTGAVDIPANECRTLPVRVSPAARKFLGRPDNLPFQFRVQSPAGAVQQTAGQVTQGPLIPSWLPLVLGGLFLCLCLAGGGLGSYFINQNLQLTRTAETLAGTITAGEDSDGDGLSNAEELVAQTDPNNPDTDGDGLNDGAEVNQYGTNPRQQDTDNDTLLDGAEVNEHNTSPTNADTDNDGAPDGVEIAAGTNPIEIPITVAPPTTMLPDTQATAAAIAAATIQAGNAATQEALATEVAAEATLAAQQSAADQTATAQSDADGDGLSFNDELNVYLTSPTNPDSDGDGINDGDEVNMGLNPADGDTDDDGLDDGDELDAGSNPLEPDTDGDTLQDGAETLAGTNPLVADTDGDGLDDSVDDRPLVPFLTTANVDEWGRARRLEANGHTGLTSAVAYSPDGQLVATSSTDDDRVVVWMSETGEFFWDADVVSNGQPIQLAFSTDGAILAASANQDVNLYNVEDGAFLGRVVHPEPISAIAISPAGTLATASQGNAGIYLWDLGTGNKLISNATSGVSSLTFSPDGNLLVSGYSDGNLFFWDANTLVFSFSMGQPAASAVVDVDYAPDGDMIAVTTLMDGIQLRDTGVGLLLDTLFTPDIALGAAFSPDSTMLGTYDAAGNVQIWDVDNAILLRTLLNGNGYAVAFSPDAHQFASGSQDGPITLWEVQP